MSTLDQLEAKSERIDLRTTPSVKRTLQEAAASRNKTVTEFVLDTALTEAAELRLRQQRFVMSDAEWQAFTAALDAPAKARPRLEALLNTPSLFD